MLATWHPRSCRIPVGGNIASPNGWCVAWPKNAWPARGSQVIPSGYSDTFPAVVYQQEI